MVTVSILLLYQTWWVQKRMVQYYHYACCTKSFSLNDYSVFNESIRIKDDATVKVMVTKLRLTISSLTISSERTRYKCNLTNTVSMSYRQWHVLSNSNPLTRQYKLLEFIICNIIDLKMFVIRGRNFEDGPWNFRGFPTYAFAHAKV